MSHPTNVQLEQTAKLVKEKLGLRKMPLVTTDPTFEVYNLTQLKSIPSWTLQILAAEQPEDADYEAFSEQQLACTVIVNFFAHAISGVTNGANVSNPADKMTVWQMHQWMESCGIQIPIFGITPTNLALVATHLYGKERADGFSLFFVPAAEPGQAELLDWHLPEAHWVFVKYFRPSMEPMFQRGADRFTVAFSGPFPISVDAYWHATQDSPEYQRRHRYGQACRCERSPCIHHPVFAKMYFMDADLAAKHDSKFLRIAKTTHPSYSIGANDALVYRSHGMIFEAPKMYNANMHFQTATDIFEQPEEELDLFAGKFYAYHPKVTNGNHLIVSILYGFVAAVAYFAYTTITRITVHNAWLFHSTNLFIALSARLGESPVFVFVLALITALVAVIAWFLLRFLSNKEPVPTNKPPRYDPQNLPEDIKCRDSDLFRDVAARVSSSARKLTTAEINSLFARAANRNGYRTAYDVAEVEWFVTAFGTQQGAAPIVAILPGSCVNCLNRRPCRKLICHRCREMIYKTPERIDPIHPRSFVHVGTLPIVTVDPSIPSNLMKAPKLPLETKEGLVYTQWRCTMGEDGYENPVTIKWAYKDGNRRVVVNVWDMETVMALYHANAPKQTVKGILCGPMIMGQKAVCFKPGIATTMVAFACRMAIFPPTHSPITRIDDFRTIFEMLESWCRQLFPPLWEPVNAWTRQQVLDHVTDTKKKAALIRCYKEIDDGECEVIKSMVIAKSFSKMEKHFEVSYEDGEMVPKKKQIPRLINSFHPHLNAVLAPITLPLSKQLNRVFNPDSNILYAAGCSPEEINKWMNASLEYSKVILEDDVSMSDGSHSEGSFTFTDHLMRETCIDLDNVLLYILHAIRHCDLHKDQLAAFITWVNNSGVPLTSWQNSVVFILTRLYAFARAFHLDLTDVNALRSLIDVIRMAVSGDDGKTFIPMHYNGVCVMEPQFLIEYSTAWADCGFSVASDKIRLFGEHNWRMATFLAMRPVWSGSCYEYGPEPSRRLRSAFWMFDHDHHPVSWARGVVVGLMSAGAHVPVLSDICEWYLNITAGAANFESTWTHIYNPFHAYEITGAKTMRGINEFLTDYGIAPAEYADFRRMLRETADPFVNLTHIVLEKIIQHE